MIRYKPPFIMIIDYFEDCLAPSASPSTEFTLSVAERAQGFGFFRASLPATAKQVNLTAGR